MSETRYVPTAAEARRSNVKAAVLVGVLTPALGWLEGFEDILALLSFGVVMGLLTYGFYALIARVTGPAVIEVTENHLTIERKSTRTTLPWPDIASVRFTSYGGVTMAIARRSQRSPLRVRLDGHSSDDVAAMQRMIDARIGQEHVVSA